MGSRRRSAFVLVLVLGLLAASLAVIQREETTLGLDLRGGTQLVYEARPTPQTPEITPEDMDRAIEIIRERTDELGVSEPEIQRAGSNQIQVGLPDVQDIGEAKEQIGTTAQLYLYDFERNVIPPPPPPGSELEPDPQRPFNALYDAVEFASDRTPSCPGDACTTTGPTYYLFDRNTHQVPEGAPQQGADAKRDLFLQFDDERQPPGTVVLAVPQGTVVVRAEPPSDNPDTEQDESAADPTQYHVLRDLPELSGTDITNPEQNFDPTTNQPNVTFDFTDDGREAFQRVTQRIAERGRASAPPGVVNAADASQFSDSFAIVLDNEIVSRPIINFVENPEGIDGRTGAQISGSFTIGEAQDLANLLRIGALPVKLALISQSTVSATLGEQALDEGLKAGAIGLLIVIAFLIAYYRFLGVVAVLGLAIYAVFFFALIKLIPITLTLPGIAGLILTIGVAADANIVIFERIKEEVRAGRSMLSAISQGYRKGIATIIDANVITLVTAFILFVLATAGVKGFAFTLGIGTIVSLFTAVLFTQAFLAMFGRSRVMRSPRALGAGERHVRWNFDFTGASRWFFSMSGVILAVGAVSLATQQLNLGIDFESGTKIEASLEQPAGIEDVRDSLAEAGISGAESAEVQEVENPDFGPNVVQIQAKIPPSQIGQVQDALDRSFGLEGGNQGFQNTSVGPTFGEQVARSAVIAIIASLLVISAYVAIRFEAKYAIPVIIALIHDILITGGVYSLTDREVTSGTVAAFLTILGYSMYDTIIVFDRIRENVPRMPRAAFSQIVNRSMSEVMTRSLITGLSTVFLVTVLFMFGGATLKDFAFAMMVGVASGFYSSIFIASPVLTHWKEREPAYRGRRAQIVETMGYVPVFPEDNVVAKTEPEHVPAGVAAPAAPADRAAEEAAPVVAPEPPLPAAVPRPQPSVAGPEAEAPPAGDGRPAAPGALPADRSDDERAARERRKRQQKRRRKHGRRR